MGNPGGASGDPTDRTPADVTQAMHRQMKAERERRAVVTEAEGDKRSRILKAEGVRESQILEAEGEAQAIETVAAAERFKLLTVAEGEAQAIEKVFGAIHQGDPTPDLIAIRYLEALQGIADGQATKIFLPLDTSGVLGSVAAIGELLKETGGANQRHSQHGFRNTGPDRTPKRENQSIKKGVGTPLGSPNPLCF